MQVRDALLERIRAGVPFLGICLGLQACSNRAKKLPKQHGLGLFRRPVRALSRRCPRSAHGLERNRSRATASRLLRKPTATSLLLFRAQLLCAGDRRHRRDLQLLVPYTAVLETDNVFGVQFHPEKSGPIGLGIVRNFVEL